MGDFSRPLAQITALRTTVGFRGNIRIPHDTTPAQIRRILDVFRAELTSREDIDQENQYVRFNQFGKRGFEFKSVIYVKTTEYQEFLAVAEELNLRLVEIVEEAGARLAEPLVTVDR